MSKPPKGRTGSEVGRGPNAIAAAILAIAYFASIGVILLRDSPSGEGSGPGKTTVIRVAHSLSEDSVQTAFTKLARDYESIHPEVSIVIQAIPERAYNQWRTTQFMGGSPPDLVQITSRGDWTTATKYQEPLTAKVGEPNPYNAGTDLEGVSWRDTYIDGMEGGYYFNLLEFYSIPLTLNTTRIYYNKDLFQRVLGSDQPPRDFQHWMEICRSLKTYAETEDQTLYPIAASREDDFFGQYFPALTGGMTDPYEVNSASNPNGLVTVFGLHSGVFDLKHDRIRTAFALQRELASHFQPSFISDMPDQTRFYFLQRRAAMVVGNTLDIMLYEKSARFRVGVFDFPFPDRDDPKYGRYFAGPVFEEPVTTFSFGLSKSGRNQDVALDFMKFCTAVRNNEWFCSQLNWYPAIRGAHTRENLEVFKPRVEGVARYPVLVSGPDMELYFAQRFPLFLAGRTSFDELVDGLEKQWLTNGTEWLLEKRDQISRRNLIFSERTVTRSRVKMLFEEAGELRPGQAMGSGTQYQLGIQILLAQFAHGFTYRYQVWNRLQDDSFGFVYPPPSRMPDLNADIPAPAAEPMEPEL